MKRRSTLTAAGVGLAMGALLLFGQRAQTASALPTFAQAYGVDCSACHSMIPALNAYGRYIQSTAFGGLDPAVMKRAIPIAVRESISYRSTGRLNRTAPNDKYTELNLSLNVPAVLSKAVSMRLEQSLYSNNLSGGNTSHFWVSLNQLLGGNGHLVVGKFDMPAPSPFSYWGDVSGFSGPGVGAGQHGYNLGGERWGVRFNYVPTNYAHEPIKVELAYAGNSQVFYDANTFGYYPGSDKGFQGKIAWARPDNPIEAGIYGAIGSYVLGPNYVNNLDAYNVIGVYAQRDPVHGFPQIFAYYQVTNDSNVGPGRANQLLQQAARTWSYAVELDQPFFNGNVVLGVRPVEYVSGLQASRSGFDVVTTPRPHFGVIDLNLRDPKLTPYLYLQLEAAMSAATNTSSGGPTWRAGLRWASPVGPAPK